MRFSKSANKTHTVRIDQSRGGLKQVSKHRKGAPGLRLGVLSRVAGAFRKRKTIKALPGTAALTANKAHIKTAAYKQTRLGDQEINRALGNRFGRKEKRLAKQVRAPRGVGLDNRVE